MAQDGKKEGPRTLFKEREILELVEAFGRIRSPLLRRALLDLIQAVGATGK